VTAGDISLLIGAVAGLIGTVAGFVISWQKKAALDADALEKERNRLRRRVEGLLRHIHALRTLLAENGIEAPPVPDDHTEDSR
jgi:hypothetical protein